MRGDTPRVLYLICCTRQRAREHKKNIFRKGYGSKIFTRTELCMKKHITYKHTYKTGLYQLVKMMSFTHTDWDKCDIINNILILTKRGSDTIHTIIPKKYQKYQSTTILKHENVLVKVNKSPYVPLLNITIHYVYSITIYVFTTTL